jgi:hypothetical protein
MASHFPRDRAFDVQGFEIRGVVGGDREMAAKPVIVRRCGRSALGI